MEEKIQKLSEGMDFLEEACGYGEPLEFTEAEEGVIFEANGSKPSPYKVLGRCSGVFQPIGEYSRNKRIYSSDLWPRVLEGEELKSRLAHRAVFGCLGHADKLVDDRDIQEGKVSHIVTVLEVREDNNGKPFLYGELEILDTPAGRILEAMYKGGANLYVSSRAAGRLTPIPGDPENRMLVSPSNYHFHCFDIVARPGFLQARPAFEAVPTETAQPQLHESSTSEENIEEARKSEAEKAHDKFVNEPAKWEKEPNKECEYRKAKYEEAAKKHGDLKIKTGDYNSETPEVKKAGDEVTKAYKELEKARKDVYPNYKTLESSEIENLKGQINKLTKIIEKVVDDVYEIEEPVEEGRKEGESDEEMKHRLHGELVRAIDDKADKAKKEAIEGKKGAYEKYKKEHDKLDKLDDIEPVANAYIEVKNEALADFISLMADSTVSEKVFEEIVDMIAKAKENK